MDSYNSDLQAFKSNLCQILQENSSDPQLICVLSKTMLDASCPVAHHQDLQYDNKTSSEWKFEEHIYFEAGRWPAGKTNEDAVRAAVEEQY